jgi:plasmid stabilization system protein ParE
MIRASHPRIGVVVLSQHADEAVEKHVNAIFSKRDPSEERYVHRRVAAVLTYLRDMPRAQTSA